jgi:hypothetical protein
MGTSKKNLGDGTPNLFKTLTFVRLFVELCIYIYMYIHKNIFTLREPLTAKHLEGQTIQNNMNCGAGRMAENGGKESYLAAEALKTDPVPKRFLPRLHVQYQKLVAGNMSWAYGKA